MESRSGAQPGSSAIPVILDHLRETDDPVRRAWMLAMLWNLAGQHYPGARENRNAFGTCVFMHQWPSVATDPGSNRTSHREISTEAQERLLELWRPIRTWYKLEVLDG